MTLEETIRKAKLQFAELDKKKKEELEEQEKERLAKEEKDKKDKEAAYAEEDKLFGERFGKHFAEYSKGMESRVTKLEEDCSKIVGFMEELTKKEEKK